MGKSIKSLAARIEADNERFTSLSKAEKRVEIARDCLERIALKQLSITQGKTVDYWNEDNYGDLHEKSIKEVINSQKLSNCQVCAKGGLFMSYVGRVNECIFQDVHDDSGLYSYEMQKLQEIFEPMQLDLIELAFEQCDINNESFYEDYDKLDLKNEAIVYRDILGKLDDDLVVKSICKNIIKNKGEFVPSDIVSPNARIK